MIRKGDKIGPYTLLEKLGKGGFGVVWLAEKRSALAVTQVALKMPNDDDIDLDAVRREAALWVQASGHPNVLSFIDADIYEEQVVIVSEYAPDGSLATLLKKNGGKAANIGEAIELTSGILSGLAHLHSRKIIHRDLKPANILLQGKTPRLVDFGLARVMKSTSHSRTVSGTYAYMPPETFEGGRSEQTDIWSAGVILYEMLSGRLPYLQDNDAALIGAILHGTPEPLPEHLNRPLRAVVERAMEKDLNKRFKTATEMGTALHDVAFALQTGESRQAKTEVLPLIDSADFSGKKKTQPMSTTDVEDSFYKTKVMEQPATEMVSSFESQSAVRNTPELPLTEIRTTEIQELSTETGTMEFREPTREEYQTQPGQEIPSSFATTKKIVRPADIATEKTTDNAGNKKLLLISAGAFAVVFFIGIAFLLVYLVSNSPSENGNGNNGNQVTENKQKTINITGRELGVFQAKSSVNEVAVSADGKLIASVGEDNNVRLWRINEGNLPVTLSGHTNTVRSVAISPDGQLIASGSDDKTIRLWSLKNAAYASDQNDESNGDSKRLSASFAATRDITGVNAQKRRGKKGDDVRPVPKPTKPPLNINYNRPTPTPTPTPTPRPTPSPTPAKQPDNKEGNKGQETNSSRRTPSPNKSEIISFSELRGHSDYVFRVSFSEDGQTIVSASYDKTIRFWNVSDGNLKQTFEMPDKSELIVNISPDLKFVAFYLPTTNRVRVWSLVENKPVSEMQGDKFEVHGGAFSPDGNMLALGSKDGAVRLYRVSDGGQTNVLQGVNKETGRVIYNPGGKLIAAGYSDGSICLWNAEDGRVLKTLKGHTKFVFALAFSADDRVLASGGEDQTLRLWEITVN